jgi:hypothetical protein
MAAPYEKAIIALSTVAIVGGGIYVANKYIKSSEERKRKRESKEFDDRVDKDLDKEAKKKPASLTQTNYSGLSKRLYQALNRWSPNTVEVYQVLANLKNDRDVYELIKAFGTKLDSSNGVDKDVDKTLPEFMEKLTDKEIYAANIELAKKAIKYRF